MFNFMKKGSFEKDDKRKKEKERKKKRERGGMTAEELLRLDEMRRSLKIRSRRKEKEKLPSGITADYSENFFAELDRDPEFRSGSLPGHTKAKNLSSLNEREVLTPSDSSEASLNSLHNQTQKILPPLPPRPPKRGILKGSKTSVNSADYCESDPNSTSLLVRNTLQNEVITYQNIPQKNGLPKSHISADPSNGHPGNIHLSVTNDNNLLSLISTSPSAESLTDTTNSSFATPPFSLSPVGENQGFTRIHSTVDDKNLDLPLPCIIPIQLPKPRELTIYRTSRGDFGFQLRRAIITDKLSSVNKKTVIFTEPGAIIGNKNETGLLPGDILLEVNGIQVQDKSREEIIDLIKSSGSNVAVKVQPIPELCELTRRSGLDGHYVVLDDSNIRGGTLKRSGSLRFKKMTFCQWRPTSPLSRFPYGYLHADYLGHRRSPMSHFHQPLGLPRVVPADSAPRTVSDPRPTYWETTLTAGHPNPIFQKWYFLTDASSEASESQKQEVKRRKAKAQMDQVDLPD